MTTRLKSYPAYKPSGVEWLSEVPAHWKVTRVRSHYAIQLGKMLQNNPNCPNDIEVPYLKAIHVQWFHVQTATPPTMWANPKEINPFGIRKGDLLVCEGGEGGRCGIIETDVSGYIIQNALHRVRPREGSRNEFLQYVLSTAGAAGWFDALNSRATIGHFTSEKFSAFKIPLPPLPEQQAITAFLDRETAKIDVLVAKRERLIELLQEKRTALISHAVTRGLAPDVPMKDSGVEWLEEIPAHWEVRRLRALANIKTGGRDTVNRRDDGDYPFFVRSQTIERIDTWSFDGEAVLTAGDGVGVGKVFHYINGKFDYHQRVYKFSDFSGISGEFFFHYFKSMLGNEAFQGTAKSTVDSLRLPMLQNFPVTLPPLHEQRAIAAFLDHETERIDELVAKVREAIDRLKELRTTLISAAVTGRIDVREEAGCS